MAQFAVKKKGLFSKAFFRIRFYRSKIHNVCEYIEWPFYERRW